MGKRKDRERAKHFIFRGGRYIPRADWDKHQRELKELKAEQLRKLKEAKENARLRKVGLVRGKANILTPDQVMKERRPINGKDLPRNQ